MSDLRRLRRLFFSELRRSNLSPKQRALQIKLFREFVGLLRNIKTALRKNGVKDKPDFWRLYNLLPGVGVVEVTAGKDPERGYWVHPHLHMFVGISGKCSAISVFPQVLLTAIWREVTGGKFFITHVKVIQSKKAVEYFESYVDPTVEGDFPRKWIEFALYRRRRFVDWRPRSCRWEESVEAELRRRSLETSFLGFLSQWFRVSGRFYLFVDSYMVEELGLLVPPKGVISVRDPTAVEWFLSHLDLRWWYLRPPPWKLARVARPPERAQAGYYGDILDGFVSSLLEERGLI